MFIPASPGKRCLFTSQDHGRCKKKGSNKANANPKLLQGTALTPKKGVPGIKLLYKTNIYRNTYHICSYLIAQEESLIFFFQNNHRGAF